jgi:hypothetical protein
LGEVEVKNDSGNPLNVQGAVTLGAGSMAIGSVSVTSIAAGTNNIGDVDVLTLPALPAGTNSIGKVEVSKQPATIQAPPVAGAKTVSTTAAELFAGASRLTNRYTMSVYNESSSTVYWGPSGVTTVSGYPLLPGDSIIFNFDRATAVAVYFIAAASAAVRVVELA